jgi:hypothetical protein
MIEAMEPKHDQIRSLSTHRMHFAWSEVMTYLISQPYGGFPEGRAAHSNRRSRPAWDFVTADTVQRSKQSQSSIALFGFGAAAGVLAASIYLSAWLTWTGLNLI